MARPSQKDKISKPAAFIVAVQEPHINTHKRITELCRSNTLIFDEKAEVVRAAIWLSSHVIAYKLDKFCNGDIAVAQVDCNKTGELESFIFASIYLDIHKDVIPPQLQQLVDYCNEKKLGLLCCLDSNAHSVFWGSRHSNARGGKLENFIFLRLEQG